MQTLASYETQGEKSMKAFSSVLQSNYLLLSWTLTAFINLPLGLHRGEQGFRVTAS